MSKKKRVLTFHGGPVDVAYGMPVSFAELLDAGTADEIRQHIGSLGVRIRSGLPLFPQEAELLGAMLEDIGQGANPKVALGLSTNRKIPLRVRRARRALVESMVEEGATKGAARDVAERLRFKSDGRAYLADEPDGAERFKKREITRKKDKPTP